MGAAVGLPAGVLYAASKATVEQLTRGWAAELGPRGVRVNTVSPGITVTDGTAQIAPQLEHVGRVLPAGRLAQPQEIASAAVYLASDEASTSTARRCWSTAARRPRARCRRAARRPHGETVHDRCPWAVKER